MSSSGLEVPVCVSYSYSWAISGVLNKRLSASGCTSIGHIVATQSNAGLTRKRRRASSSSRECLQDTTFTARLGKPKVYLYVGKSSGGRSVLRGAMFWAAHPHISTQQHAPPRTQTVQVMRRRSQVTRIAPLRPDGEAGELGVRHKPVYIPWFHE